MIPFTGNSARSQMAEGSLRSDGGDGFEVEGSGMRPGSVRPEAIQVMREDDSTFDKPGVINRGADIKKHTSRFEADSLKVWRQSFIDNRWERGQQPIGAYKLHKP